MPAVGTQLELNVDTETPTFELLPRTSHPAVLSLPLFARDATFYTYSVIPVDIFIMTSQMMVE